MSDSVVTHSGGGGRIRHGGALAQMAPIITHMITKNCGKPIEAECHDQLVKSVPEKFWIITPQITGKRLPRICSHPFTLAALPKSCRLKGPWQLEFG